MRPILPAILLLAVACSAPRPMTSSSAMEQESVKGPKTLVVREQAVELGETASTVVIPVANERTRLLEIVQDPKRTLVLRVEGIGVTAPPGVIYEVLIAGSSEVAGVLSFYGAEEANGSFIAAFPIDKAAAEALRDDAREMRVTFRPRGITDADGREVIELQGRARFTRLRLVEE